MIFPVPQRSFWRRCCGRGSGVGGWQLGVVGSNGIDGRRGCHGQCFAEALDGGRTFALWGLAFKPNTDDLRQASSLRLIERLRAAGVALRVHDPEAMPGARALYPSGPTMVYCDSPDEAVVGADALALVTEWKAFWSPDFSALKSALREAVIFDGRNVYDPDQVERAGLAYYGIGRGRSLRRTQQ